LITLVVIFILYNVFGVVLILLNERGYFGGNPLFYSYLAYAIFFCPLIALSAWLILRRHGRGLKELGLQWGRAGRTLLAGGGGGLVALASSYGAYFLIVLVFYLIAGRSPVSAESQHMREMGGGYLVLVVLVTVVLAPVFEEIFFRGLLYPALRRRTGYKVAVILDGLIFAVMHFKPLFMISLILVGIVLAFIYEKTESLFAPIITHAFYNLVVVAITFLFR
jgi:membrane protease YdiL (CAAX protease family)